MYQITFLVPTTHVDEVKAAMFERGAGKIGNYQHCAWQVLGEGQFMAMEQANPFVGKKDQLTKVPEYYVQMVCEDAVIRAVVAGLKEAHPYEEPAYQVVKLESLT